MLLCAERQQSSSEKQLVACSYESMYSYTSILHIRPTMYIDILNLILKNTSIQDSMYGGGGCFSLSSVCACLALCALAQVEIFALLY